MKRIASLLLCLLIACAALASCGAPGEKNDGKLNIVATIFPEYDWLREIAGDKAEITLLADSGVDLHSYRATIPDIAKISECDVFVYVGGESDEWVKDALAEKANENMVVVSLMELLGDRLRREETPEGAVEDGDEEKEDEYDEHVWISLKNAKIICEKLAVKLGEADADNAGYYAGNAAKYAEKLDGLDARYKEVVEKSDLKAIVVADRFPFRYLADDYGLEYYAAFSGCSAESDASFSTVIFLAGKIDELGTGTVLETETADGKTSTAVVNCVKSGEKKTAVLHSLQSVTAEDIKNGATYLSLMEKNLGVLEAALRKGN